MENLLIQSTAYGPMHKMQGIYAFSTPSEYFQLALAVYNFVLRNMGRGIKAFESTQLTKKGKKCTNYKIPVEDC